MKIAVLFSALSFLAYGFSCIRSEKMRLEFERFGLARQRVLTGALELVGAIGLLVGLIYPLVGAVGAGGLTLLMLLGLGVRIRIGDSFLQSSPALFYAGLNAVLFAHFTQLLP